MLCAISRRVPVASAADQICRPFDAQTRVARQPVGQARRIDDLRQISQLMNDHICPRPDDGIPQGILIENVDDNRVDAGGLETVHFLGGAGRAGNGVPGRNQKRRQPPSDRAARSSKKNPHDGRQ